MKNLIHEIHRRSLWQVLGIYGAAAWLVLQVVDVIIGNFGLPEWVAPFALILLLIGLPIVLATAFVNEGVGAAPEGQAFDAQEEDHPPTPTDVTTASADPAPDRPAGSSGGRALPWLTWRRAVLGGIGAFALLGILTAGYLAMRSAGIGPAGTLVARGVLDERSSVLVADFEGADAELANATAEALRIDLGQSRVVTIVEPTEIADVLRRMERPADTPLDLDLAREVAQREGISAVIAGDIDRAGAGFVMSARLVDPVSGEVLTSDRQTASDESEVLDAIDRLSRSLRERIGESLRDLNREEPLDAVTTRSLPALRRYSAALRALDLSGDDDRAIALLDEAVALDSTFAMAWRKLGTILNNRFTERARAVSALERAYEHRDRLTERERYQVEAMYRYQLGNDVVGSIHAYENLLDIDPADDYALNNLGVMYGYLREHERAREYYEAAIGADSTNAISYTNALQERFAIGDVDGAYELLRRFEARFPGHPDGAIRRLMLAGANGNYDEAERIARELADTFAGNPFAANQAREAVAATLAVRGRIGDARGILQEIMSEAARREDVETFLSTAVSLADIERPLGNDRAVRTLGAARTRFPEDELHPLNRPYGDLARTYAMVGDASEGAALLAEMDEHVDPRLRSQRSAGVYAAARAYVAAAEGDHETAVEFARLADRGFCTACGAQTLANAYDAAGQADSAIAAYRRYVDARWMWRLVALDQFVLAENLERLGQLYDAQGDLRNAAEFYGRFVSLWEDADPPLQPRVEAARARLEAILREIG